jgi:hypothetical protein
MVAAYVALLLGYVFMKNAVYYHYFDCGMLILKLISKLFFIIPVKEYEYQVKELLPEKKFTQMIVVLKKFYEFLKLTANVSSIFKFMHQIHFILFIFLLFFYILFSFFLFFSYFYFFLRLLLVQGG